MSRHARKQTREHVHRTGSRERTTRKGGAWGLAAACTLLVTGLTGSATAAGAAAHASADPAAHAGPATHSLAREVLGAGDGFASEGAGTTGGAAADAAHVFTVATRAQLVDALKADPGAPRIIQVQGTIDANTDAAGNPLGCDDYAAGGYTLDGYLAAYDPAVWGRDSVPSGPLEDARAASEDNQAKQVELKVPSDTTVVGLGGDARLLGADLQIKSVHNVIVRNLTFEDAFDCFPQWDPTDTSDGNWNSDFDNVVVDGSHHVWIDHDTFTDGRRPDSREPRYFGRVFEQHDGMTDMNHGSDFVTDSWNVYTDHDKTLLWGGSDSAGATDDGHLRITLHHNLFKDVGQRAPRVRFGQVDTYNNHYVVTDPASYVYSLGVGISSHLVAEDSAFDLPPSVSTDRVISVFKGTALTADGNLVNDAPADLIAAYNAAHPDAPLGDDAGFTPTLRGRVDNPHAVPDIVDEGAGAGRAE